MADAAEYTVNCHKNSYREVILEISTPILTLCTKRYQSSISRKSIRHFGIENSKMAALKREVVFTQAQVEISTPFQMINYVSEVGRHNGSSADSAT